VFRVAEAAPESGTDLTERYIENEEPSKADIKKATF
jgi:hypothetical protein